MGGTRVENSYTDGILSNTAFKARRANKSGVYIVRLSFEISRLKQICRLHCYSNLAPFSGSSHFLGELKSIARGPHILLDPFCCLDPGYNNRKSYIIFETYSFLEKVPFWIISH